MAERILVVRNRYIGETLLAIPFLRNLRRRFPEAVIDVLIEPGVRPVLSDCPYVDELLAWERLPRGARGPRAKVAAMVATARWLRSRRYTRAYILKRSFSTALLVWLAGIPHRVGLASDWRSMLLTRRVAHRRFRHEAELYLDHLRADGIEIDDGRNENWVCPAAAGKVAGLLATASPGRPRVFVAPQSSSDHKQWPLERMAAVVRWLVKDRGCAVYYCGAPQDVLTHQAIRSHLDAETAAHVHDFSSVLSLRETAALMARIEVCVGVDTGLPHLAASFGVPVVTLFGSSDPRRWAPWRVPHAVVQPAWPSTAMADITVDHVLAATDRLMAEQAIGSGKNSPPLRTIDLRNGRFRYDVIESPAAGSPAAGRPVDAAV